MVPEFARASQGGLLKQTKQDEANYMGIALLAVSLGVTPGSGVALGLV